VRNSVRWCVLGRGVHPDRETSYVLSNKVGEWPNATSLTTYDNAAEYDTKTGYGIAQHELIEVYQHTHQ